MSKWSFKTIDQLFENVVGIFCQMGKSEEAKDREAFAFATLSNRRSKSGTDRLC
jgi:hypothetical protein